jgi:predicted MFS family arabinose efflux permease
MAIFLIAAGAILRYAVDFEVTGIEIHTVGLILMLVGIAGLIISLAVMFLADRDRDRRVDDYPTRRY